MAFELPFTVISCAELTSRLSQTDAHEASSSVLPLLIDVRHSTVFARSHILGAVCAPVHERWADEAFMLAKLPRPQRAEVLNRFTLEALELPDHVLSLVTNLHNPPREVIVYDAESMKLETGYPALPLMFALHRAGVRNIRMLAGAFCHSDS